jgi:hypothetical protein
MAMGGRVLRYRHRRLIADFLGLPAGRPTGHLRPIRTLEDALARRLQSSLVRSGWLETIRALWERIVGPPLASLCWPVALSADALSVRATGSTAVQEWTLRRQKILDRLRQIPGLGHIRRLYCSVGAAGDANEKFPIAVRSGERRWNLGHDPRPRENFLGEPAHFPPYPPVDGGVGNHPPAPAGLPAGSLKLRLDEGHQQTFFSL